LGSAILHNGLVGWHCQKQDDNAPALSTTKAEYCACSKTGQDVRWVEQLLDQIYPLINLSPSPVRLYCNNQGEFALLKDSIYQHHWLCHHIVQAKNLEVLYIATTKNITDFLTKPLQPKKKRLAVAAIALGDIEAKKDITA
jgi:hypothetical protein